MPIERWVLIAMALVACEPNPSRRQVSEVGPSEQGPKRTVADVSRTVQSSSSAHTASLPASPEFDTLPKLREPRPSPSKSTPIPPADERETVVEPEYATPAIPIPVGEECGIEAADGTDISCEPGSYCMRTDPASTPTCVLIPRAPVLGG